MLEQRPETPKLVGNKMVFSLKSFAKLTIRNGFFTFDQHHHSSRLFQFADHLLQRVGAHDSGALRFVGEKIVDLLRGSIVGADHESVVVHVQDQVLAHHGETDQRDVGTGRRLTRQRWRSKTEKTDPD